MFPLSLFLTCLLHLRLPRLLRPMRLYLPYLPLVLPPRLCLPPRPSLPLCLCPLLPRLWLAPMRPPLQSMPLFRLSSMHLRLAFR